MDSRFREMRTSGRAHAGDMFALPARRGGRTFTVPPAHVVTRPRKRAARPRSGPRDPDHDEALAKKFKSGFPRNAWRAADACDRAKGGCLRRGAAARFKGSTTREVVENAKALAASPRNMVEDRLRAARQYLSGRSTPKNTQPARRPKSASIARSSLATRTRPSCGSQRPRHRSAPCSRRAASRKFEKSGVIAEVLEGMRRKNGDEGDDQGGRKGRRRVSEMWRHCR